VPAIISKLSSKLSNHRIAISVLASIAILIVLIGVASYFMDPILRTRMESAMNAKLTGYHTRLGHAHLQLLDGVVALSDLVITQNAHPNPPVAGLPVVRAELDWDDLLSGHIVARFTLTHPRVRIDLTQLRHERAGKVPIAKRGWQEALQAVYPFKINRLKVVDGAILYIDTDPNRPLNIEKLNLIADNIRNIKSARDAYPSRIHAEAVMLGTGTAAIDGHANFLAEPFAAVRARYRISHVPLGKFEPEVKRANLAVTGGQLASTGSFEYGPKVRSVEAVYAYFDGVAITYSHSLKTAAAESARLETVKQRAAEISNAPGTLIKIDEFDIGRSTLAYADDSGTRSYRVFVADLNLKATNISNHPTQGPAHFDLRGKFMNSGDATAGGDFRTAQPGPDFDLNLAIANTDLTTLNDLLRRHENLDVASGTFSLYSQMGVHDGQIHGYVKPLFSNLKVYSWAKDKDQPLTRQAYELVAGGTARLFQNDSTGQVATEVTLKGNLSNPSLSTWEAIKELLRNAFVQAILPGFDREAKRSVAAK